VAVVQAEQQGSLKEFTAKILMLQIYLRVAVVQAEQQGSLKEFTARILM